MKKALLLFLSFSLLILCGCFDYSETENSYVVSSVGFQKKDKGYVLLLEVANGGEKRLLKAEGESYKIAFQNIKKGTAKTPDFGHTALIVLADNLTQEEIKKAVFFCEDMSYFSPSAVFAVAQDPQKILEFSPIDKTIGYDVLRILKENKRKAPKLYEAWNMKKEKLPRLLAQEDSLVLGDKNG